jgi:hypothetical protein
MKIGGFWQVFAVSALVAAFLWLTSPSVSPLLAFGLFALSCAGYFALQAVYKAGMLYPAAEYAFLICAFGSFFIAGLTLFSLQSVAYLMPFPVMFSIPAVLSLASNFAAKLSG